MDEVEINGRRWTGASSNRACEKQLRVAGVASMEGYSVEVSRRDRETYECVFIRRPSAPLTSAPKTEPPQASPQP